MMGPDDYRDHREWDMREPDPDDERRLEEVADEIENVLGVMDLTISRDGHGLYLDVETDESERDVNRVADGFGCRVVDRTRDGFVVRPR